MNDTKIYYILHLLFNSAGLDATGIQIKQERLKQLSLKFFFCKHSRPQKSSLWDLRS